jgi:hypothetical protein
MTPGFWALSSPTSPGRGGGSHLSSLYISILTSIYISIYIHHPTPTSPSPMPYITLIPLYSSTSSHLITSATGLAFSTCLRPQVISFSVLYL